MQARLHKVLAHCGIGSRRECETIIEQGRVTVNGRVVTKLGSKVDPETDRLVVDGEAVGVEERVYYLVNKPPGYICTNRDDEGRPRAVDLIRQDPRRIYTVGRLDEESEGLLLLTNDGDLANVICHPRYQVDKTYRLAVRGPVSEEQVDRIQAGVWLAEGKTAPAQVRRIQRDGRHTIVTATVWEGRNRELRRIFAKVDLRVVHLVRVAIGPLHLEGIAPGQYRRLMAEELAFARARLDPAWRPTPPPAGHPSARISAPASGGGGADARREGARGPGPRRDGFRPGNGPHGRGRPAWLDRRGQGAGPGRAGRGGHGRDRPRRGGPGRGERGRGGPPDGGPGR
ncbi:MAG: pseudouridine synthase [Planctomycetaceae bacterium]